jgi:hypothetical protein
MGQQHRILQVKWQTGYTTVLQHWLRSHLGPAFSLGAWFGIQILLRLRSGWIRDLEIDPPFTFRQTTEKDEN